MKTIHEKIEILKYVGCTEEGMCLVPPVNTVVPVDKRRLITWDDERLESYISDIRNALTQNSPK